MENAYSPRQRTGPCLLVAIAVLLLLQIPVSFAQKLAALEMGKMRVPAKYLTTDQRKAVAQFLTGKALRETPFPPEAYSPFTLPTAKDGLVQYSGWDGDLEGTGYRSEQQAGISTTTVGKLKLKEVRVRGQRRQQVWHKSQNRFVVPALSRLVCHRGSDGQGRLESGCSALPGNVLLAFELKK